MDGEPLKEESPPTIRAALRRFLTGMDSVQRNTACIRDESICTGLCLQDWMKSHIPASATHLGLSRMPSKPISKGLTEGGLQPLYLFHQKRFKQVTCPRFNMKKKIKEIIDEEKDMELKLRKAEMQASEIRVKSKHEGVQQRKTILSQADSEIEVERERVQREIDRLVKNIHKNKEIGVEKIRNIDSETVADKLFNDFLRKLLKQRN